MNFRAQSGNFILIFAFTALIIVIAVGIGAGVYLFYGAEYDVRAVEAELLAARIQECVLQQETLFGSAEVSADAFYAACHVNKDLAQTHFFIEVFREGRELSLVRINQADLCSLSDKNPAYPICVDKTVVTSNGTYFIRAGSNQEIEHEFT